MKSAAIAILPGPVQKSRLDVDSLGVLIQEALDRIVLAALFRDFDPVQLRVAVRAFPGRPGDLASESRLRDLSRILRHRECGDEEEARGHGNSILRSENACFRTRTG
jgi:hypothetical protein